jgi:hypothetical protein
MAIERRYWETVTDNVSLEDYPQVDDAAIGFPASVGVAYAVCSKECGRAEFIVDGSTQICYHCGGMMFRAAVREYTLSSKS